MRLYHNIATLNVYRAYTLNLQNQSEALQRISSGVKVSSPLDDPGAFAKGERISLQSSSIDIISRNVQDGVSMMQTVQGGISNITDALQRMKELVVKAGDSTLTDSDKNSIQLEMNQLKGEINDIADGTDFNGIKLIGSATPQTLNMMCGTNVGDVAEIHSINLKSSSLKDPVSGKTIDDVDITTQSGCIDAMKIVDGAMDTVSGATDKYGAIQKRFEECYDSLQEIQGDVQSSVSNIMDADVATEILNYSKYGILIQAGTAIMVQTNQLPQQVIQILGNNSK